jgi:hypothetical protein
MAVSVAPLTTTVMNAVPRNRVGVASGINNAVARTAGLLAIAALGVVMLQVFNRSLDHHLSAPELPASVRHSIDDQRINLGAVILPSEIGPPMREMMRRSINESFVTGFRSIMLAGAALALVSGMTSLLFIGTRPKNNASSMKQ